MKNRIFFIKFILLISILSIPFIFLLSIISNSSINPLFPVVDKKSLDLSSSNWSNASVISDIYGWNNGSSYNPKIVTDKNGNLHVVWHDETAGEWGTDTEIMYANYTAAGWSNATVISDIYGWNDGLSFNPSIATDKVGNLHVVWYDSTNGEWGTDLEIMYVNYTTNGWSNATVISDVYGWNNGASYYPRIATDNNGNIHVVWYDDTNGEWGTDTEIMYVNYTGAIWSNATVISDVYGWNNDSSMLPTIATDNGGNIHVVWRDETNGEWGMDEEIMYANYTVAGWSNATVISDDYTGWNNDYSYQPEITIDNNGNLHVVWYDNTDGEWGTDEEIMYVNYTASGWSNASVISDVYGWNNNYSLNPSIVSDSNGNIHIMWQDRTAGEWGTDYEIMYTNNTGMGWSNATCISDLYGWNNDDSWYPSIATDDNGNIHVVWQDYTAGEWGIDIEIMYTNKTSNFPNIISVLRDPLTPGNLDTVNITVHVTDDVEVDTVLLNSNHTAIQEDHLMNFLSGTFQDGYWYYIIPAYPAGTIINYSIWANDTTNNNDTDGPYLYTISDNQNPNIVSVSRVPFNPGNLDTVNVSVHITDNVGVDTVLLNSNHTAIQEDHLMNFLSGTFQDGYWYYIIPAYPAGTIINYSIWANDTTNNNDTDGPYLYTISDIETPNIATYIMDPPTPGNLDTVTITVHIIDNVQVHTVFLISNHTGIPIAYNMSFLSGNYTDGNWTYIIPTVPAGSRINYSFWANDTTNNNDTDGPYQYTVIDNEDPNIILVSTNPTQPTDQGTVNIIVHITDNVGVNTVLIFINHTGSFQNYPMTLFSGNNQDGQWNYIVPQYNVGTIINFSIWANDTSNNNDSTIYYNYTVVEAPTEPQIPLFPPGGEGIIDFLLSPLGFIIIGAIAAVSIISVAAITRGKPKFTGIGDKNLDTKLKSLVKSKTALDFVKDKKIEDFFNKKFTTLSKAEIEKILSVDDVTESDKIALLKELAGLSKEERKEFLRALENLKEYD